MALDRADRSQPGPQHGAARRPLLSVSLDLDNLWSYLKTHGDPGWEDFPSFLDLLVEPLLERLRDHGLTITLFIVGQDAALEKNRAALQALVANGHEIACHSFHHEPWLHRYSAQRITEEFERAEEHIERVTGQRPRGFRGPGFSLSNETLRVLARRGYLYDASTFPTFLGPLARAYYFWQSRELSRQEREQRAQLFGTLSQGLRPLRPYIWEVDGKRLVEIPVTTMPLLRVPMHLSYLIYLAKFSRAASESYLKTAMTLCRWSSVEPSLLLHPLDFLGGDTIRELSFFPGMDLSTEFKLRFFDRVMDHLKSRFVPVTMLEHAKTIWDADPKTYKQIQLNPSEDP